MIPRGHDVTCVNVSLYWSTMLRVVVLCYTVRVVRRRE